MLDWLREYQPEASVIVVTAYPSMDSALNCLRARTYDYLTKPFQIAQLQRTVVRCLESKGLLRISESALRESLGAAIRERRKALGLTLAQMAQRTGVSLGYLSQIELGKNSASIETLYRISLGLGMRISELFQTVQPSLYAVEGIWNLCNFRVPDTFPPGLGALTKGANGHARTSEDRRNPGSAEGDEPIQTWIAFSKRWRSGVGARSLVRRPATWGCWMKNTSSSRSPSR